MQTEQEGLATRVPFEMTQRMLWAQLDDFITVSDAEIRDAMRRLASDAKLMAEGAGAASLATAWSLRDRAGGEDGGWRIKWRKFAVEEIGGSACGGLT